MTITIPPRHELIGDQLENFYQIGIIDSEHFNQVSKHLHSLIGANHPPLSLFINPLLAREAHEIVKNNPKFKKEMEAYAAGLQVSTGEAAKMILLPEFLTAYKQFNMGVPTALLGCSSLFFIDEESEKPTHLRVLDFPLTTTFENHERVLHFKIKNENEIFSYGTKGFPYPSITAMTSAGISLALHQKFNNFYDKKGAPIFSIINEMLLKCSSMNEAISFLKKSHSITTWGINMLFKNGEVLVADLTGDRLVTKKIKCQEGEIIYQNNRLLNQKESFGPTGFDEYCQSRENAFTKFAKRKIKRTEKEFIREITKTEMRTLGTVQLTTLSPSLGRSLFTLGDAPKSISSDTILAFENIWKKPTAKEYKLKFKGNLKNEFALKRVSKAQAHIDLRDFHMAYHELQMAIPELDEGIEKNHATFYFLILRYIFEKNDKSRLSVLDNFLQMRGNIEGNLHDHLLLFIHRLQRELGQEITVSLKEIVNRDLQKVFAFDNKIQKQLLPHSIRYFIYPHIDIRDVIYTYLT